MGSFFEEHTNITLKTGVAWLAETETIFGPASTLAASLTAVSPHGRFFPVRFSSLRQFLLVHLDVSSGINECGVEGRARSLGP